MNNQAAGQAAGPQQPKTHIFRPEQMRQLPDEKFSAEEKLKWEAGLKTLYTQIQTFGPETPQHHEAKRKLLEFSKTLTQKIQAFRIQQAQQGGGGGDGRPQSQGQQQGEGSGHDPSQQPRQPPKPSAKITEHVNSFPFVAPAQLQLGGPEAEQWIKEAKAKYGRALATMEHATGRLQMINNIMKKRDEEGKPLTPEEEKQYRDARANAEKQHGEADRFVKNFREQQKQAAIDRGMGQQPANPVQNGTQTPTRPHMSMQQPANPVIQQNAQAISAAMDVARNQQRNAQSMPNPNIPQHQNSQIQTIKQEAGVGVPQINTNVHQRPTMGSPQSALPQSAGPQSATSQVPRALTQQQAMQTAARSYSTGTVSGTPTVMGHSHPLSQAPRETGNVMTNKMPIPKHLPERATAPPQPVTMAQPRPTLSGGPSNSGNGVVGAPVIPKMAGYSMDANSERVLNKKKLDELVRQVTGGGEGVGSGEVLTPDVEESMLQVADDFVDNVLQSACRNAKERGSKMLEIRDIQLTLERAYNIRIPGYASDEIRTVRKIQPAANWISKMSAVQAAKVTGGRNAD